MWALKDELEFAGQTRPEHSRKREQLEERQGRVTVCGTIGGLASWPVMGERGCG